jgi:hypothetical protein
MTLKKQLYLFGADFDNIDLAKVCGLGFVFFRLKGLLLFCDRWGRNYDVTKNIIADFNTGGIFQP